MWHRDWKLSWRASLAILHFIYFLQLSIQLLNSFYRLLILGDYLMIHYISILAKPLKISFINQAYFLIQLFGSFAEDYFPFFELVSTYLFNLMMFLL